MVLFKTLMSTLVQFAERKILLSESTHLLGSFCMFVLIAASLKSADHHKWQEPLLRDFPDSPMVKNLPAANVGDTGFIPGPGTKIPPSARQLSLGTTTTEPTHSGGPATRKSPPTHTCRAQWWLGRPRPVGTYCSQWQRQSRCSSKPPGIIKTINK